jgi:hypothetical protein
MSVWTILNGAAWILTALLLIRMGWDFIQVERDRRTDGRGAGQNGEPRP